jgi:cytoskeletal protein CcmA (bactofilin family)
MTNRRFGWHSGKLTCREIDVGGDFSVDGDLVFGDASADSLTIKGAATFEHTVALEGATTFDTNTKLQFRDTGLYINSSADGQLDIVADTTVALSGAVTADSTLDVTGNTTVGGTLDITGLTTATAGIEIAGADKSITFSGTNTGTVPALVLPDDTYIADADGSLGPTAGFIVVDIGGTNYKLQTYEMS